jgi:uncharacterized protein YaiL (DUF2058 family)
MPIEFSRQETILYKEGQEAARLIWQARLTERDQEAKKQKQEFKKQILQMQVAAEKKLQQQKKQAEAEKERQLKQAEAEKRKQEDAQIENLLQLGSLTMAQIAIAMNVSLYRVRKVKKAMKH